MQNVDFMPENHQPAVYIYLSRLSGEVYFVGRQATQGRSRATRRSPFPSRPAVQHYSSEQAKHGIYGGFMVVLYSFIMVLKVVEGIGWVHGWSMVL